MSPLDNPNLPDSFIYLPIKGENLVRDAKNNWKLPTIGETRYKVYLKDSDKRRKYLPSKGIDSEAIELEGYLVDPMFFPLDFILPARLRCELAVPNRLITGIIRIELVPANPASFVLGQKIQGIFTIER